MNVAISSPPKVAESPERLREYESYRDSKQEWIGDIPSHWKTPPLYARYECVLGKMLDAKKITGASLVPYVRNVDVQWDDVRISDLPEMDIEPVQLDRFTLKSGDILVCEGGEVGRTAIWSGALAKCGFQKAIHRLRPRSKNEDARFFFYCMCFAATTGVFIAAGNPNTIPHLTGEKLRLYRFPVPPYTEQQAIAAFLDRETAKIDRLIENKQRLIELLAEKRTALISQAVTKGLDPNVEMKDSGIEWFGAIPKHWKITRLGWVTTDVNDINHEMPSSVDEGVPFLSAKDLLNDGTLNFTDDIKQISESDFARLSAKICPRRDDIIYSRIGACLGKARLVNTDDRFLVSYSCCVVRLDQTVALPRFFEHLLDAELVLTEAKMRTQGIGVPDLGLQEICRFPIALPPIDEQEAIANYLDDCGGQLRRLVSKANDAIDRLREYRSALISAAVTGKIDVREAVR